MNIDEEINIINKCVDVHQIEQVYSLFSGGSDSLCATYIASQHPLFMGVVHLDTGIGIPEVQEYVIKTCEQYKWPLHIYKAMEYRNKNGELKPQNYDDFVRKFGFPGPVNHRVMYSRLKQKPLQQAYRELKLKGKIAWSTGIRMAESKRRSANFALAAENGGFDVHDHKVWVNPILFWDSEKKQDLIKAYDLPVNPVYQYLCKSGECLCGAFAKPNELLEIEAHYPHVYDRLNKLYEEVKDKFPWKWDQQPSKEFIRCRRAESSGQMKLDFSPTCYSCQNQE